MLIEAAEEEQKFQQFRERNRIQHVSYVGTAGKLILYVFHIGGALVYCVLFAWWFVFSLLLFLINVVSANSMIPVCTLP